MTCVGFNLTQYLWGYFAAKNVAMMNALRMHTKTLSAVKWSVADPQVRVESGLLSVFQSWKHSHLLAVTQGAAETPSYSRHSTCAFLLSSMILLCGSSWLEFFCSFGNTVCTFLWMQFPLPLQILTCLLAGRLHSFWSGHLLLTLTFTQFMASQ